MDRRPLAALLVLGLSGAAPAVAGATSADALLAQSSGGTLSDSPSADLIAQSPKGTLSETPTATGQTSSGSSDTSKTATASPAALPFTGSDPRVMLALGLAAILAGAGLRLRTGDARDY